MGYHRNNRVDWKVASGILSERKYITIISPRQLVISIIYYLFEAQSVFTMMSYITLSPTC
jgi:hypothetical protein